MRLLGCVFTPSVLVLLSELFVKEGSRPLIPAISLEAFFVVRHCPVRCLVLDQVTVLQSREGRADRSLVDISLGRDLSRLERPVAVSGEEADLTLDSLVKRQSDAHAAPLGQGQGVCFRTIWATMEHSAC